MARNYFRVLALFWLTFGVITIFYPRFMQLFMTQRGEDASSEFADNLWLHDGLDILAVSILLLLLSTMPITQASLRAAAVVSLIPVIAIVYSVVATPFWSELFLLPAAAALGLSIWGLSLAQGLGSGSAARGDEVEAGAGAGNQAR